VNDHALAAMLAEQAGQLLLSIRDLGGDEGDRRSNEFLLAALAEHRPADSVLSEESVDDLARLASDRVWIIDPLDGTREYGEPPRDDWAVHVALTIAGAPVAGAVADAARRGAVHGRLGAAPPGRGHPWRVGLN
jgi:3'(2'), 5'-bisphosphate nucleotidase